MLSLTHVKDKFTQFTTDSDPFKGKFYFDFCFKEKAKSWFHARRLDRFIITTFCRMRSNHYYLSHSLHRKNLTDSPTCPCGEDDEDLNHIFWSCPRFNLQCAQVTRSLERPNTSRPILSRNFFQTPTKTPQKNYPSSLRNAT